MTDRSVDGRSRGLMVALTAIGGLAIPALFLPFAWDESPWTVLTSSDEILGAFRLLAWPFLLSLPITFATVRWLAAGALSPAERAGAYVLAAAAAGLTIAVYFTADIHLEDFQDWVAYSLPLLSMGLGIAAAGRALRSSCPETRSFAPVLAMQAAFLPSCVMNLASFLQDLQPGGYCSMAAAVAFVVQVVMMLRSPDPGTERSPA